jgi:hypothetical protein
MSDESERLSVCQMVSNDGRESRMEVINPSDDCDS